MTTDTLNSSSTLAGVQTLLAFPFRQPRWQEKLLLGALCTFLGFVIPILPTLVFMGYCAEVARRAIDDGALHLPEWKEWDKLLLDGLKLFGAGLLYTLPSIGLMFVAFGFMIGASIVGGILADTQNTIEYGWLPLLGLFGGMLIMGLALIVALLTGLLLPVASMHIVATGDFMSALRFREWWPILRANLNGFVWAYLLILGVGLVLGLAMQVLYITVILCFLVPFLIMGISVYTTILYHAVFGLAYRDGKAKLAALTPAASPQ